MTVVAILDIETRHYVALSGNVMISIQDTSMASKKSVSNNQDGGYRHL